MPDVDPAEGERSAVTGFGFQYRDVAAALIYRSLLDPGDNAFESASFVDPRAGKVDDVQITTQSAHHAYQVKWTSSPSGVTLRSLTVADDGDVSPLQQLYDGWQTLRGRHGKPVRVHWLTNALPSTHPERNDFAGEGDARPPVATMAAFLDEVHRPYVAGTPVPERWKAAWASLRESLQNVSETDFDAFMRAAQFDLGYAPVDPVGPFDVQRQRYDDIQRLWAALFDQVGRSPKGARVDVRGDHPLLAGLVSRLRLYHAHDFPPPDIPLVEGGDTLGALGAAVDVASGGYVGLIGSPGAGKSTLLSAFARARRRRGDLVVSYYAYTSDGDLGAPLRAESAHFLHDVVLLLHQEGVGDLSEAPGTDRTSLHNALRAQLADLGARHARDSTRSILVVDGLDHVPRAHPERGFLADLPTPEQLPDGVTVVVGSQTEQLDLLPGPVRTALSIGAPGRVEVVPLTYDEVAYVLAEAEGLPPLPADAAQTALDRTEGHRLALALLVHRLRNVGDGDAEEVARALGQADLPGPFYERLWSDVGDDAELHHLLALAARVPGAIDLTWFRSWANRSAVQRLYGPLRHLFRREDDARWFFFHDSARGFVLERTSGLLPGDYDGDLHRELADRSQDSNPPHAWDELFHRDQAGDRDGVARLARPQVVRDQFVAFRPSLLIRDDLERAASYTGDPPDPALFVSIAAASFEVALRSDALGRYTVDPALRLARYGRLGEAARRARTGRSLHVPAYVALDLAPVLLRSGLVGDAQRLYDLSRPRDLLDSGHRVEETFEGHEHAVLQAWTGAAPLFEPLPEIAAAVDRVSVRARDLRTGPRGLDDDGASRHVRRRLFVAAARALAGEGRWDDLNEWVSTLSTVALPPETDGDTGHDLAAPQRTLARVEARILAATFSPAPPPAVAAQVLAPLRDAPADLVEWTVRQLGPDLAARAAMAFHEVGADADQVSRWIPPFSEDPDHPSAWLRRDKEPWFRSSVLLRLLDRDPLPSPDPEPGSRSEGFGRYRQAVARLADLGAAAHRDDPPEPDAAVDQLVGLFSDVPNMSLSSMSRWGDSSWDDQPDWSDHPDLVQARHWLYATAVEVAAQYGPAARDGLLDRVTAGAATPSPVIETRIGVGPSFWTFDDVLAVAVAAHRAGASASRVAALLGPLESHAVGHEDLDSRVEQLLDLSWTHHEVGDDEAAYDLLQRAGAASLGVGYRKDYQLGHIASLLGLLLDRDGTPEAWAPRVSRLAHAIVLSAEGAEKAPASAAAQTLVAAAFAWRPTAGRALARFFSRHEIGWEPLTTLNVLREAVREDPETVPLATDVFVHHVLPGRHGTRLSTAYPDFAEALVRASGAGGAEAAARDLSARLDALEAEGQLPSSLDEWKSGIGAALHDLGHGATAADLGIPPPDVPETTFRDDQPVLGLDGESPVTWSTLRQRAENEGLLPTLHARYDAEEVAVWGHLVATAVSSLSPGELSDVTAFVDARPELARPDVYTALFQALFALGQHERAWEYGQALLEDARRKGFETWSPAYNGGPAYRAATDLVEADPDGAPPRVLRLLALDAARSPGAVFSWVGTYLGLLGIPYEAETVWSPIAEYLDGLVPDAAHDAVDLDLSTESHRAGLVRYALDLIRTPTGAYRLGPALSAELRRHPTAHESLVREALDGPDNIRRPLLRLLATETRSSAHGLLPLLEPLRDAVTALPHDLRHYAQASIQDLEAESH